MGMKLAVLAFALFAAVVAEPEAEASPDAYYGYHGYGLGYRGYGYGHRYGYGGYGYPYHGYGYGYYRGKRSADADPAVVYAGAYHPYAFGYHPYAFAPLRVASGSSFQHVSTPAATYGVHQLHKREAEADADPSAYYGYGRYYGHGYGYRAGYYGGYGRYGYGYGR